MMKNEILAAKSMKDRTMISVLIEADVSVAFNEDDEFILIFCLFLVLKCEI